MFFLVKKYIMRKLNSKLLYVFCAASFLFLLLLAERKDIITIFMIGDSTMANKSLKNGNIERGWGQMLPEFLIGDVRVDNHAMNGRSSQSFIERDVGCRTLQIEERRLCIYPVRS